MSNYHVQPLDRPQALTKEALRSLRNHPVQGMSRRRLLRVSLGGGMALWLTEMLGGFIALFWPNLEGGFGDAHLRIGTLEDVKLQNSTLPVASGFPSYFPDARAFIVLVGAALIPFVDRGDVDAHHPSKRKTAIVLFTLFCILGLTLTFIGIFFRGPGYAFVIPYLPFFENSTDGLHFSL